MPQVWLTVGICYGKVSQVKRETTDLVTILFLCQRGMKTFAELEAEEASHIAQYIAAKALCDMFKSQNVLE